MSKTSLFLAGVLSLSSLAFAGSKTYDISLPSAVKAGNLQLPAGDYTLKLQGSNAILTDAHTRKSFTAPVKVGTSPKKFSFTAVETSPEGTDERITGIELGGSTTQIEFTK